MGRKTARRSGLLAPTIARQNRAHSVPTRNPLEPAAEVPRRWSSYHHSKNNLKLSQTQHLFNTFMYPEKKAKLTNKRAASFSVEARHGSADDMFRRFSGHIFPPAHRKARPNSPGGGVPPRTNRYLHLPEWDPLVGGEPPQGVFLRDRADSILSVTSLVEEDRADMMGQIVSDLVRAMLTSRWWSLGCTLFFVVFAIWSLVKVVTRQRKFSFELTDVMLESSRVYQFVQKYYQHMNSDLSDVVVGVYAENADTFAEYQRWLTMEQGLYDCGNISLVYGWAYEFEEFLDTREALHSLDPGNPYATLRPTNHSEYMMVLRAWIEETQIWHGDVVLKWDLYALPPVPVGIELSRIWVNQMRTVDTTAHIERYVQMRDRAVANGFFIYAETQSIWAGLLGVEHVVYVTALVSICGVFLVMYLTLKSVFWAGFLAFVIALIALDFLATCYIFGIYDDQFKAMGIAMAFGFTVDFNLHLVHRYIHLEDDDTEDPVNRVVQAVRTIGGATFNGGLSTLLIVLPGSLGFAANQVQRRGSITFALIMVLGVAHSLLFVPNLLLYTELARIRWRDQKTRKALKDAKAFVTPGPPMGPLRSVETKSPRFERSSPRGFERSSPRGFDLPYSGGEKDSSPSREKAPVLTIEMAARSTADYRETKVSSSDPPTPKPETPRDPDAPEFNRLPSESEDDKGGGNPDEELLPKLVFTSIKLPVPTHKQRTDLLSNLSHLSVEDSTPGGSI